VRVGYVTLCPFMSGADRSLQTTILAAGSAGIEPVLFCPPGVAMHFWAEDVGIAVEPCELAYRDKRHPLRWWRSVARLKRRFRQRGIELVHANQVWAYPAAGTAAGALGLPRICHMRDEVPGEAIAWCCRSGVELVLSISDYIQKQVEAEWPASIARPRLEALINPVQMPPGLSAEEEAEARRSARQQWGLERDAVVLGFIGQVAPVKGLLELIGALSKLPAGSPWQLVVAGRDTQPGAPYESACRARVAELGLGDRVRLVGFLDDVTPFYRAIDVAVVPSLEEPLGRVPLEAASYGRPSIAFAVGGLPETIEHGTTGWLVRPGDFERLGEALSRFVAEPQPGMGESARQRVGRLCNPNRYAARLIELYDEVRCKGGSR
jgi:glycosyltransferase involved in cell wall biosynthesis